MGRNEIDKLRWLSFAIFIISVIALAWQSDDAYHGYVMARRLVWGQGFVYNAGERSTASTCPLFTLLIAFAFALTHEMYFTSLAVCVIFSAAAFYILIFRLCRTKEQVLFCSFLLIASEAFLSYTTSGLENSLLFFLGALFVLVLSRYDCFDSKRLLALALIVSLTAMARMDSVLLYVPVIVWVYLFKRDKVSFPKAVGIGILGLLPFILWELFSCFYYGFPFPNPAYVKLGTHIASQEYIKRGILYYIYTALDDPIVVFIPVSVIVICMLSIKRKFQLLAAGVLLYLVYIIRIGGDFMMGRHFTNPLFLSVCIAAALINSGNSSEKYLNVPKKKIWQYFFGYACACIVISITFGRTVGTQYLAGHKYSSQISDEREYYIGTTGLYNNMVSLIKEGRLCVYDTFNNQAPDELRVQEYNGGIVENAAGIVVYKNPDLYLNDTYALGDPFLSKLPAKYDPNWRVGHLRREVPEGYQESIWTDSNKVKDPELHELYESIRLVTRGPLWSMKRIKAIIDLNLSFYR